MSPYAACLVKPSEPLKYPERADKLRVSGAVKARLSFSHPDRAPKVEVLAWSGDREMVEEAEIYLASYRMPCLAEGQQLALEQELVFNSDEGAHKETAAFNPWDCLRTPGPFSFLETQQTGTLIRQRTRGNVLLEMSFEAPDAPPKVREVYNSGPSQFRLEVLDHVSRYRLSCMKPGQEPVAIQQAFHYAGSARGNDYSLRDMGIVAFLGAIKDVDKVPVSFDLDAMSCPFKLRWTMYQPAQANGVAEIGARVPSRKPFIAWLETLTMQLSKDQYEALFGAHMVITLPCGKIEL
ncbi:hypothetical protein [Roseateles violae]|uniref:Uncharacterized protein n=1 Tax=Roseateles violae TaxID=3058042 RepID=A0ABT8DR44_9BURK|nr:hypothetical protein [Pelomonas sp. PFR6]MDN3918767.1 hypothetical protein [Pelomonas sp. PFR6]